MSSPLIQALEAIDSAFSSGLAATLTGMTLTAASLLANLVKSQSDKVKDAFEKKSGAERLADAESDPAERNIALRSAQAARKKYDDAMAAAAKIKDAFQALIVGFAAFAVNLVSSLTLDPNVEKSLLSASGLPGSDPAFMAGMGYLPWLATDVGVSLGSFGVGMSALCFAAATMWKVVPKL